MQSVPCARELRRLSTRALAERIAPVLRDAYENPTRHEGTALSAEQWLEMLAESIRVELKRPADAAQAARFAFVDAVAMEADALNVLHHPSALEVLQAFADGWARLPAYDYDTVDAFFGALRKQFKEAKGLSGTTVMQAVRTALTGSLKGPCLVVVSVLLGKDRCLERIYTALKS